MTITRQTRRRVLQTILAGPVLAGLGPAIKATVLDSDPLITSADQALDVFDFERVARANLPPAHWGYLATGVDGDATLHANAAGFYNYSLRVRRMVDLSRTDMSVNLFGTTWETPIFLDPVGSQRAFHPDGELATARAAQAGKHLQVLSTQTSTPIEDVMRARGEAVWYQLYPTDQWTVTQGLVKRAQSAGCSAFALTVDLQGGSNRETAVRAQRRDTRQCASCHKPAQGTAGSSGMGSTFPNDRRPMFTDLDVSQVRTIQAPAADWDYAKRLRDLTPMKFLIKGIVTREDAELAVQHGIDGVIVSNHGGRGEESGRGTIESLVEVVEGVKGRIPVIVDGGFRRGTDIFKALALGANAVMIGRPYLWGLGAFGQAGVEAVLEILRRELQTVMRQAGTVRVAEINRSYVVDRQVGR